MSPDAASALADRPGLPAPRPLLRPPGPVLELSLPGVDEETADAVAALIRAAGRGHPSMAALAEAAFTLLAAAGAGPAGAPVVVWAWPPPAPRVVLLLPVPANALRLADTGWQHTLHQLRITCRWGTRQRGFPTTVALSRNDRPAC